MSALLGYSYSTGLTKEEESEINQKTKKSREEFAKGFGKGASFSLAAYSLYLLTTYQHLEPGFKPLSEKTKGQLAGFV